jgi:hypothetical protein
VDAVEVGLLLVQQLLQLHPAAAGFDLARERPVCFLLLGEWCGRSLALALRCLLVLLWLFFVVLAVCSAAAAAAGCLCWCILLLLVLLLVVW